MGVQAREERAARRRGGEQVGQEGGGLAPTPPVGEEEGWSAP